ncbi:MAG TPA: sigma-70 family RNA polymerase sigma factor, partial [Mucilaginibacter sp.]|nr:sigma-70 family RNA polymerase sigma factor [Mucilaginibacter sp.]
MTNYNACTDPQLLNLLRSGDRMAYTEIYDRYALALLGHVYNKARDREESKDVVHEVFATLWAKRESLQIDYLAGYLFRSVRNVILNQIAHRAVQEKFIRSMEQFAASNDVPDHLVREKQLTAIIEREIAALPPKMREVFVLSRKEHLSHKEIAQLLGI